MPIDSGRGREEPDVQEAKDSDDLAVQRGPEAIRAARSDFAEALEILGDELQAELQSVNKRLDELEQRLGIARGGSDCEANQGAATRPASDR